MTERFAPARVTTMRRADGAIILASPQTLANYPPTLGALLAHWAQAAPDRVFLAERDGTDWRRITFAEAYAAARAIGQALLDRGLGPERPVMVLADNGIDHGLLALGAMQVGVPVAPVSPAYARLSQDFGKLKYILGELTPGLIYVRDKAAMAKALAALDLTGIEVIEAGDVTAMRATSPSAVDRAFANLGPDTVAKILFTSGSTALPKGVINTQRMLCANQQAIVQVWPFLAARPPVIVDWLPWNHTFGSNFTFNMMLRHGGTLYIDEGKPAPGLIDKSLANLRAVSPTVYFNVPRGFAMLVDHLERDEGLRANFFRELDLAFYAGAALPPNIWARLVKLSSAATGAAVPIVSAWGTTETAPMATIIHFPVDRPENIGLPGPGHQIKLAPSGDRLEIRAKGPNITPGYWRRPDLTAQAFDDEGWYLTGDAAKLADDDDPAKGILFDGRIGENFKLTSGTWVNVGALRLALIAAAAPVIEDCVITGHNRDEIGVLVFPSLAGCRSLCPEMKDATIPALIQDARVRAALQAGLAKHNRGAPGSSTRVARARLMDQPPAIDANEITDKGYINQRAVLTARAHLVESLHGVPAPDVLSIAGP